MFLLLLRNNWKAIAIGVVALLLLFMYGYVQWLKKDVERAEKRASIAELSLAEQQSVNERNLSALEGMKKQHEADLLSIQESEKKAAARQKTVTIIKEKIIHVKPEDDAPTAPVLRDALNSLREATAPANQDSSGKGASSAIAP